MSIEHEMQADSALAITKSTNEKLLALLLPKATSESECQKIVELVREKNAFSKRQGLFLALVASRPSRSEIVERAAV